MKNNKNMSIYIMVGMVLIAIFLIYSNSQKEYFLIKDMFYEWVQFNTNGVLIVIGAFATIFAVVLTIQTNEKEKETLKRERIKKLKLVVELELTLFIESFEVELKRYFSDEYTRINQNITELNRRHEFNNEIKMFDSSKIYKLEEKFKEYFYELMILDKDSKLSDVINLLKYYDIVIKNEKISDDILKDMIRIFSSKEVINLHELINYSFKNSEWEICGINYLSDTKDKFHDTYRKYTNSECLRSDLINDTLMYLKKKE